MVDLPAGGFPALLAARLLAHVRAAQCRVLAAASPDARRRPRHRPARASAAARHGLWIALILAALWAFVGWSFLWSRYAAINWAIAYVAPAFGLQALLLAIGGAARGGLAFDRRDIAARLGLLIAVVGLVVYPLLPPLFGRPWTSAEVFGIAPDPTAIATLGVLLAASGRLVPLLLPIPLLWLLLSGLTLRTMGDPQAWLPLLAAATIFAALTLRRIAR